MVLTKTLSFLLFILLFIPSAFSQTKKADKFSVASIYFSTEAAMGFEFNFSKKYILGAGFSFNLASGAKGKDYSGNIGPGSFPADIYEVKEAKSFSFYVNGGLMLSSRFGLYSQIGFGGRQKIYNSRDRFNILSTDGYYYFTESLPGEFLYGGSLLYIFNKSKVTGLLGYDNFNGVKFGVGLRF